MYQAAGARARGVDMAAARDSHISEQPVAAKAASGSVRNIMLPHARTGATTKVLSRVVTDALQCDWGGVADTRTDWLASAHTLQHGPGGGRAVARQHNSVYVLCWTRKQHRRCVGLAQGLRGSACTREQHAAHVPRGSQERAHSSQKRCARCWCHHPAHLRHSCSTRSAGQDFSFQSFNFGSF